jgi:CHAT domain-containing protein
LHALSASDDSGQRYYLDDFFPSISYASCLPELLSRPPQAPTGRPAALAVLDMASTDLKWLETERRFFQGVWRRFQQQGLSLQVVTRAADLPSDLSAYRSINWSGHACSSPTAWGASFLQFGGASITAAEIAKSWRLVHRPVVTLAACSSAIDLSQAGVLDEYCGLDLAFRIAGAEAVFATLWHVHDDLAGLASTILFQTAWNSKSTPGADIVLLQRCLRTGRWAEYFLTESQLAQLPREDAEHTRQVQQNWLTVPKDHFAHERHWSVFRCFGGSAERR